LKTLDTYDQTGYDVVMQTNKVTRNNLNGIMDFDTVIKVDAGGNVEEVSNVYGPEAAYNGAIEESGGWSLMDGYSGQSGYSGPIMHDSEYIGGNLAQDILDTPGYYVVIASYYDGDTEEDDMVAEGWAVAYKESV
jgi:hypothetical protein